MCLLYSKIYFSFNKEKKKLTFTKDLNYVDNSIFTNYSDRFIDFANLFSNLWWNASKIVKTALKGLFISSVRNSMFILFNTNKVFIEYKKILNHANLGFCCCLWNNSLNTNWLTNFFLSILAASNTSLKWNWLFLILLLFFFLI